MNDDASWCERRNALSRACCLYALRSACIQLGVKKVLRVTKQINVKDKKRGGVAMAKGVGCKAYQKRASCTWVQGT